jgi:hypothetical protein
LRTGLSATTTIEDLGLLILQNQPASGNSFTVKLPINSSFNFQEKLNIFVDLEIHRLPQNYISSLTESKENRRCIREHLPVFGCILTFIVPTL